PGNYHANGVQFSLRGQKCSWRNDDLARDRKDRAFHCHQHNDARISAGEHPVEPCLKEMMHIVIPSEVEESLDVEPNELALVQSKIRNPQSENYMSIYRRVLRYYRPFLGQ